MAKKKASPYVSARNLPCIGIWSRTASSDPTAGNTLVGLWFDDGGSRIEYFCAFYQNAEGDGVDPDDLMYGDEYTITYHSRQGGNVDFWDEEIDPPDYWAECRFLIPEWGGG